MKNIFNFDNLLIKPSAAFIEYMESKKSDTLNDLATFSDIFNNTVVDCHSKHNCMHNIPYNIYKEMCAYVELKNSQVKSFTIIGNNQVANLEKYNIYIKELEILKHYIANVYNPIVQNYYMTIFNEDGVVFKKELSIRLEKKFYFSENNNNFFENTFKEFLNNNLKLKEKYFQYIWGKKWKEAMKNNSWM